MGCCHTKCFVFFEYSENTTVIFWSKQGVRNLGQNPKNIRLALFRSKFGSTNACIASIQFLFICTRTKKIIWIIFLLAKLMVKFTSANSHYRADLVGHTLLEWLLTETFTIKEIVIFYLLFWFIFWRRGISAHIDCPLQSVMTGKRKKWTLICWNINNHSWQ